MSGRANCNPHRFQPSMGETRTTRALSIRIVCRSFTFLRMGAEGISSDIRDRRRKGLRIASSAPPALSLSKVQNSRNSLPCPQVVVNLGKHEKKPALKRLLGPQQE